MRSHFGIGEKIEWRYRLPATPARLDIMVVTFGDGIAEMAASNVRCGF